LNQLNPKNESLPRRNYLAHEHSHKIPPSSVKISIQRKKFGEQTMKTHHLKNQKGPGLKYFNPGPF